MRLSHSRTGTLRAKNTVKIYSQEEGLVRNLSIETGDIVSAGDILILLDDTLIKVQLDRATAQRKQLENDVRRLRKLRQKKIVSDDEYTRALTNLEVARADELTFRTRSGYTKILSPLAGVVTARHVEVGNLVQRYDHLLTVSDPSTLFTELQVSELLIPRLQTGDTAIISIDALGEQTYSGRILRIYPEINPQTRRGTIEVAIIKPPSGAMAGQFCRVSLSASETTIQAIDFSAVQRDQDGEYVFILDTENIARRTGISTGSRFDERIEVVEGLQDGQFVVTRGFSDLSDGKKVVPVNENL